MEGSDQFFVLFCLDCVDDEWPRTPAGLIAFWLWNRQWTGTTKKTYQENRWLHTNKKDNNGQQAEPDFALMGDERIPMSIQKKKRPRILTKRIEDMTV